MQHLLFKASTESWGELDKWRAQLDKFDWGIIRLFAKRVKISKRIGEWKRNNHKAIVDSGREAKLLSSRLDWAAKMGLDVPAITKIFCEIINLSRKVQE